MLGVSISKSKIPEPLVSKKPEIFHLFLLCKKARVSSETSIDDAASSRLCGIHFSRRGAMLHPHRLARSKAVVVCLHSLLSQCSGNLGLDRGLSSHYVGK